MLLSIVIPVYNECEALPALISALRRTLGNDYDYEVIFIDDGSIDGTSDMSNVAVWVSCQPASGYRPCSQSSCRS